MSSKNSKIRKPDSLDPKFIKKLEDKYGPVNLEHDFFSPNMTTYYKTSKIDKITGQVSHNIIPLANFEDALQKIKDALQSMKSLSKTKDAKGDDNIRNLALSLRDLFNKYRTHLRNSYPEQYKSLKMKIDEVLNNNQIKESKSVYNYTLKLREVDESSTIKFHRERIGAFKQIQSELNDVLTSLSNYENQTVEYYKSNPSSFDVLFPTDIVLDYIKDIKKLLKDQQ